VASGAYRGYLSNSRSTNGPSEICNNSERLVSGAASAKEGRRCDGMDLFRGSTADEVWRQAYKAVMASAGRSAAQPSRAGNTFELLHTVLEINDPRQRWITSRHPAINLAFGIAEALWILAGSNDAGVLNYWFPGLPEFQGEGPTYSGAYGYRLRRQFGIDQVRRACDALAANPTSRQVVLQLWDTCSDLPHADGAPRCADVPCNIVSLLTDRCISSLTKRGA